MSDATEEPGRGYLYGTREETARVARGYLCSTRDEFETNMREVGNDARLLEILLRLVRMEGVLDGDSEAAAQYQDRVRIVRLEVLNRMARLEVQTRTDRKAQLGLSPLPARRPNGR